MSIHAERPGALRRHQQEPADDHDVLEEVEELQFSFQTPAEVLLIDVRMDAPRVWK